MTNAEIRDLAAKVLKAHADYYQMPDGSQTAYEIFRALRGRHPALPDFKVDGVKADDIENAIYEEQDPKTGALTGRFDFHGDGFRLATS